MFKMNGLVNIYSHTVRGTLLHLNIFSIQLTGHSMILIIHEEKKALWNHGMLKQKEFLLYNSYLYM